jgi:hypothetical protein
MYNVANHVNDKLNRRLDISGGKEVASVRGHLDAVEPVVKPTT